MAYLLQQYTACDTLNISNPCNSTTDFPIRCVAADVGWTCFCEVTQTLGRDCANFGKEKIILMFFKLIFI